MTPINRNNNVYKPSSRANYYRTVQQSNITTVAQNSDSSAAQALQQVFSMMSNLVNCYAADPNSTGGAGNTQKDETSSDLQNNTEVNKEDEIRKTLEKSGIKYDSLSDAIKSDAIKKYDAYTNILKLSDSQKSDRIVNYVKALQAKQIELAMGDFDKNVFDEALKEAAKDPECPTDEELENAKKIALEKRQNCELKIVDSEIEKQRASGTDEEYIEALKNRGQGYVDMYDTDNDGKISFEEFKAHEEQSCNTSFSSDETEVYNKFFNKIDRDKNGNIDANEMATHLFAVSRMHDKADGPNTVSDITFGEWHDSQQILNNENVEKRYNEIGDKLYNVL